MVKFKIDEEFSWTMYNIKKKQQQNLAYIKMTHRICEKVTSITIYEKRFQKC